MKGAGEVRKLSAEGAVLDGVLERVTFANPETGYTIARIAPERSGAELVTAVGPLLGAHSIGRTLGKQGRPVPDAATVFHAKVRVMQRTRCGCWPLTCTDRSRRPQRPALATRFCITLHGR